MAVVATDPANNISSYPWPLPATATVTFIVAKGPIHHGEIPELLMLPVVRVLRRGGDRLDDGLNERLGLVDLFPGICRDEAAERLLVMVGFVVRAASAFLDGALPSDDYGGAGLVIHVGEAATARAKELADEVRFGKVLGRRAVAGDNMRGNLDQRITLILQTLTVATISYIDTNA